MCVLSVSLLFNNNFPCPLIIHCVEQFLRNCLSTRLVTDETPGLGTGTYNTASTLIDCHSLDVSALEENFEATPMVLPIRGCLDSVRRLLKGDLYIGRGSRQRSLVKSRYCNTFKVSEVGREMAIDKFRESLRQDQHKVSESDLGRGCRDCLLYLHPRRSGGFRPKQIHSTIWNTPQIDPVYGAETIRPSRNSNRRCWK